LKKLWATIQKDSRILLRDKIGLTLMFAMPIVLVIIVTFIQNNTFQLIDKKNVPLVIYNSDTGKLSKDFVAAIDKIGMFKVIEPNSTLDSQQLVLQMHDHDALAGLIIPVHFSAQVTEVAKSISGKALNSFGLEGDTGKTKLSLLNTLTLYYKPEIQPSIKLSIEGALNSSLQMIQSRQVLKALYFAINEKPLPDSTENSMLSNRTNIAEVPLTRTNNALVPNASQHNVPAWTIFAMFFIVMSLAGSIVREKLSGSFIRLKTLPTNYAVALASKQITYLVVTLLQATVIFAIGLWLFPYMGLPALNVPGDIAGLVIVTIMCGWCAVSYAICIGVFAKTQEQANGVGAVSIVILAVIGGLMIPGFAMPGSFKYIMQLSPLHWCLQLYYGLFLEGGKLTDVIINVLPLFIIIILLQLVTFAGLKRKNLI